MAWRYNRGCCPAPQGPDVVTFDPPPDLWGHGPIQERGDIASGTGYSVWTGSGAVLELEDALAGVGGALVVGSGAITEAADTVGGTGAAPMSAGWHHVAADRDASGTIRIFRDGVMIGKDTGHNRTFNAGGTFRLGGNFNAGSNWMHGYIDEFRLTIGSNRYGSDAAFVPGPLPRTADGVTDMLFGFEGVDGATTFVNEVGPAYSPACVANSHIETDSAAFGNSSIFFDGSGDYATTGGGGAIGAAQFTVEGWVRHLRTPPFADEVICQRWEFLAVNASWDLVMSSSQIHFSYYVGSTFYRVTGNY